MHFLCKPSFPVERLGAGMKVWEFNKSRGPSDHRRGLAGKILRVWRMIGDLRSEAKQVDQLAEKLLKDSSTRNSLPATTSAKPRLPFSSLATRNILHHFGWVR